MSKSAWLQLGLEKAGITEDELATGVRQAFDENKRLLTATKIEVKVDPAGGVHEVEVPDNQARQRAIDTMFDLAGVRKQRSNGLENSGPAVVINMPGYYSKEFLEKEQHVVDVSADYSEDR